MREAGRRYHCGNCGREVWICKSCDRGHRYCPGDCALEARRRSCRRAGQEHRSKEAGRLGNARRQREWYQRKRPSEKSGQNLTHHSSPDTGVPAIMPASVASDPFSKVEKGEPRETQTVERTYEVVTLVDIEAALSGALPPPRCHFCGRICREESDPTRHGVS